MVLFGRHLTNGISRCLSCCRLESHSSVQTAVKPAQKALPLASQVLVSTCHDIYANLALEDWLYDNRDFSQNASELLLLWYNNPCVVIGRHQNVWVECSVQEALNTGVSIARRRSGGGTVYHDTGNLNVTFFTGRKNYDRKGNLAMIAKALRDQWKLDVEVSKRDDLILNNLYKISGTAAKLGGKVAYHHCTLLLNADLVGVSKYLRGIPGISSKATSSVRMSVANLSDEGRHVTCSHAVELLTDAYCRQHGISQVGFAYIDPTDERLFPGIHSMRTKLKDWDWVYGHTPKFQISRTFSHHVCGTDTKLSIRLEVDHGHISSSTIEPSGHELEHDDYVQSLCQSMSDSLHRTRFWPADIASVTSVTARSINGSILTGNVDFKEEYVRTLLESLTCLVTGQ